MREISRKHLIVLIVALLIMLVGGCDWWERAYEEAAKINFRVSILKGATASGMIKMMEPSVKPSPALGDTVEYVIEQRPDTLYTKLMAGETDMAVIPIDMAAKLHNGGSQYQIAAISGGGLMYVLTNGVPINGLSELKGKEVQIAGKGSAADIVLKYLLSQSGINPDKDLALKYVDDPEELVQNVLAGKSIISLLPEPYVSRALRQNSNINIALNMQEEWTRINGTETPLVQTCLVVRAEVAARDPEEMDLFLKDFANSIGWVNKNPAAAARLLAKHDIGMPEEVAEAAISRCNLKYMSAKDAKPAIEKYMKVLLEISPDLIGGKLPGENFYYNK